MRLITVSGPPSTGKTSVIIKAILRLREHGLKSGVVKFDCIASYDAEKYKKYDIPVQTGLSGGMCPDHYFVCNIEECVTWGSSIGLDILISESAGLCNRCSPHIEGVVGVCVIDCLAGIHTPEKMGPMLHRADIIVITKCDIVSPAERQIFQTLVRKSNPFAEIITINGITGQGNERFCMLLLQSSMVGDISGKRIRHCAPSAVCSFCLGQKSLNTEEQVGNVHRINLNHCNSEII